MEGKGREELLALARKLAHCNPERLREYASRLAGFDVDAAIARAFDYRVPARYEAWREFLLRVRALAQRAKPVRIMVIDKIHSTSGRADSLRKRVEELKREIEERRRAEELRKLVQRALEEEGRAERRRKTIESYIRKWRRSRFTRWSKPPPSPWIIVDGPEGPEAWDEEVYRQFKSLMRGEGGGDDRGKGQGNRGEQG